MPVIFVSKKTFYIQIHIISYFIDIAFIFIFNYISHEIFFHRTSGLLLPPALVVVMVLEIPPLVVMVLEIPLLVVMDLVKLRLVRLRLLLLLSTEIVI